MYYTKTIGTKIVEKRWDRYRCALVFSVWILSLIIKVFYASSKQTNWLNTLKHHKLSHSNMWMYIFVMNNILRNIKFKISYYNVTISFNTSYISARQHQHNCYRKKQIFCLELYRHIYFVFGNRSWYIIVSIDNIISITRQIVY